MLIMLYTLIITELSTVDSTENAEHVIWSIPTKSVNKCLILNYNQNGITIVYQAFVIVLFPILYDFDCDHKVNFIEKCFSISLCTLQTRHTYHFACMIFRTLQIL